MYHAGDLIDRLHDRLTVQIGRALQHEARVRRGAACLPGLDDYEAKGQAIAIEFLERIPDLRHVLATDVRAAYDGDPACQSLDEVIFCYPGLEAVTIYLLSIENLSRESDELDALMEIVPDIVDEISDVDADWRVRMVGNLDALPDSVADRLREASRRTEGAADMTVNVAVGYGGRQEIVDAVQQVLVEAIAEGATPQEMVEAITVGGIDSHLYTSGTPDPDLVIRTSGEQRLSGFLLWQSAYSEIWFTDAYWPEFRRVDFLRALRDYTARNRRYGK